MYVYILNGTTGCYSDKKNWIVGVYSDETIALNARNELRELLTKYNGHHKYSHLYIYLEKEYPYEYSRSPIVKNIDSVAEDGELRYSSEEWAYNDEEEREEAQALASEFLTLDPRFECDYTGVYYWLERHILKS